MICKEGGLGIGLIVLSEKAVSPICRRPLALAMAALLGFDILINCDKHTVHYFHVRRMLSIEQL